MVLISTVIAIAAASMLVGVLTGTGITRSLAAKSAEVECLARAEVSEVSPVVSSILCSSNRGRRHAMRSDPDAWGIAVRRATRKLERRGAV